MATSATACGAEAGDATPAEGARGEEGECVRIVFYFPSCVLVVFLSLRVFARRFPSLLPSAQKHLVFTGVQGWLRQARGLRHTHMHITHSDAEVFVETRTSIQCSVFCSASPSKDAVKRGPSPPSGSRLLLTRHFVAALCMAPLRCMAAA